MWILAGVLYVLNVVDAHVDAHLIDFDVSDDLTMRTTPSFEVMTNGQPLAGIKLVISR
jgi:hypothetical protein